MNSSTTIHSVRFASLTDQPRDNRSRANAADDACDKIRRLHCRILIVDDSDGFREAFADRLREVYKAFVDTADSARAAVHKLAETEAFDFVLLDIDMPQEDGIAAWRKLRKAGVFARVVLMSQDADNGARARAIDAEFFEKDDHAALEGILAECKGIA
jgi:CheY-like chemotaxis protein